MASYLVGPNAIDASELYFDRFSWVAINRLNSSWHFLFRKAVLNLMPDHALAEHFHPSLGRPTQRLQSVPVSSSLFTPQSAQSVPPQSVPPTVSSLLTVSCLFDLHLLPSAHR